MEDFQAFHAVLDSDHSCASTLTHSLSFALDDFYKNLKYAGVSAVSGAGMEAFFKAIDDSAEEFIEMYEYVLPSPGSPFNVFFVQYESLMGVLRLILANADKLLLLHHLLAYF